MSWDWRSSHRMEPALQGVDEGRGGAPWAVDGREANAVDEAVQLLEDDAE